MSFGEHLVNGNEIFLWDERKRKMSLFLWGKDSIIDHGKFLETIWIDYKSKSPQRHPNSSHPNSPHPNSPQHPHSYIFYQYFAFCLSTVCN